MREEEVTTEIIRFLRKKGWEIIAYDLPSLGSGLLLHDNESTSKNKGTISPDILAFKNELVLICEAKDHFSKTDIKKLKKMKAGKYDASISKKIGHQNWERLLLSIGFPAEEKPKEEEITRNTHLDYIFLIGDEFHTISLSSGLKEL